MSFVQNMEMFQGQDKKRIALDIPIENSEDTLDHNAGREDKSEQQTGIGAWWNGQKSCKFLPLIKI